MGENKPGGREGLDHLMPQVYDDLRRLAASFLKRERKDHTLQPTALVNEVYLRLVDQRAVSFEDRPRFFGLAAQMMRRILVNHAQARRAEERGGGATRITLDPSHAVTEERTLEVLAVRDFCGFAAPDARWGHHGNLRTAWGGPESVPLSRGRDAVRARLGNDHSPPAATRATAWSSVRHSLASLAQRSV
jgi:DNA-directed RNA polymerase specialized sigma24 family protein